MSWNDFVKTLLVTALAGTAIVYVWILIVDPYDTVWFSPPIDREPVSMNQRFSYPALARKPRFDSLMVGTSSIRLLNPSRLDPLLGASFANFAMDSATPYEQTQILELFVRHHPTVRYAFFGIDDSTYCDPRLDHARFTYRPFPPWMYDENRWNDLLYQLNSSTVEMAWRQFRSMLGLWEPRYGKDGYTNFLPLESRYDPVQARLVIYGDEQPRVKAPVDPPEKISAEEKAGWTFPNLGLLENMLRTLPAETVKALILPPYHQSRLPVPGSRQAAILLECKMRIGRLAEAVPNTTVIDFWRRSRITLKDENYWDPQHYKASIAPILEHAIVNSIRNGPGDADFFSVLAWPGGSVEGRTSAPPGLPPEPQKR